MPDRTSIPGEREAEVRTSVLSGKFEDITAPSRRLALLKRFKERLASITVTVPGAPEEFLSAILDIVPDDGILILDELKPGPGHDRLLQARRCRVSMFAKGERLQFASELVSHALSNDIAYYRMTLPRQVRHYAQRGAYRVAVPMTQPLPVMVRDAGTHLRGELIDVSLSGIGFTLPRCPWSEGLGMGQVIPLVSLQREPGDVIDVAVEVRFAAVTRDGIGVRVGARYAELERHHAKALERFVVGLERRRLKTLVR